MNIVVFSSVSAVSCMLILHWLSAIPSQSDSSPEKASSEAIRSLESSLRSAVKKVEELGKLDVSRQKVTGLVPLLDQIRVEFGRLESGASLISNRGVSVTTAANSRSPKARHAKVSVRNEDNTAMKVARRLFANGVSIPEIARKTLVPEKFLTEQLDPPVVPARSIEISREQVLL